MLKRVVHQFFLTFLIISICLILFTWYRLPANNLVMHASENEQINDHCMELNILIVSILHFIILNNLSGRDTYWYCLVYMIKFIAERPGDGKIKGTTGARQCSIDAFSARNGNNNESKLPSNT